jgi:hypothetical protein
MNEEKASCFIPDSSLIPHPLLRFLVPCVFAATAAKLAELKALRRRLFILGCDVIPAFAERALKHDIIAWHKSPSLFNDLL